MESTLRMWMNSPYSWAALSIIAVAGFVITVLGLKRKHKQIAYTKKTYPYLVNETKYYSPKKKVITIGKRINNLFITKIAVWDSGNEGINSTDIAAIEPLRIFLEKDAADTTTIVSCHVDFQTAGTILKEEGPLKVDEKGTCPIPIDYMPPNNGLIIGVLHSGDEKNIVVDCRIKGGKEVLKVKNGKVCVRKDDDVNVILRSFYSILEILAYPLQLFTVACAAFILAFSYLGIAYLIMKWPIPFIFVTDILIVSFLFPHLFKFYHGLLSKNIRVPKELKKQLENQPTFIKLDDNGYPIG